MNDKLRRLKQKYNDISVQILALTKEQNHVRNKMEEACNHENLIEVEPDPFDEEDNIQYKCKDCFVYIKR